MAGRARTVAPKELARWVAGKNNVAPQTELKESELREASNVDITDQGKIRRRPGFTQVYSGTGIHSLWAGGKRTLFVEETSLKQLFPDWTVATMATGITKGLRMSYAVNNRDIYYSNSMQSGMITQKGVVKAWWPVPPASFVVGASAGGALPAGTFLVTATTVETSGRESAPAQIETFVVDGSQNVTVTVPVSSDTTRVYISPVDGTQLFEAGNIPAGNTTLVISTVDALGPHLMTLDLQVMPAGHIVRRYRGRLFTAVGSAVYFSEPGLYGLHDPEVALFTFPERVTLLESVRDGIYVGTANQVWFYQGDDPTTMQVEDIDPGGAVEGTSLVVRGSDLRVRKMAGEIAYWLGPEGPVLGGAGGNVLPYASGKTDMTEYAEGASMFLNKAGLQQILTAAREPGSVSGLRTTDSVSGEVRRNGVTIG